MIMLVLTPTPHHLPRRRESLASRPTSGTFARGPPPSRRSGTPRRSSVARRSRRRRGRGARPRCPGRRKRRTSDAFSFEIGSTPLCAPELPTIFVGTPRYSKKWRVYKIALAEYQASNARLVYYKYVSVDGLARVMGNTPLQRIATRLFPRATQGMAAVRDALERRDLSIDSAPDRVRSLLLALGRGLLGSVFYLR